MAMLAAATLAVSAFVAVASSSSCCASAAFACSSTRRTAAFAGSKAGPASSAFVAAFAASASGTFTFVGCSVHCLPSVASAAAAHKAFGSFKA